MIKINNYLNIEEKVADYIYLLGSLTVPKRIEWSAVLIGTTNDDSITVIDLYVPEQENTSVSSHFENDEWQMELYSKLLSIREEYPNAGAIGQIHSHHTMKVFFSGDDKGHVDKYINLNIDPNMPMAFIVVNYKSLEFNGKVDINTKVGLYKQQRWTEKRVFVEDDSYELSVSKPSDSFINSNIDLNKRITAKVVVVTPPPTKYTDYGYGYGYKYNYKRCFNHKKSLNSIYDDPYQDPYEYENDNEYDFNLDDEIIYDEKKLIMIFEKIIKLISNVSINYHDRYQSSFELIKKIIEEFK